MATTATRKIRSVSYAKYGYFFILPFFLIYCFFQIWPLINTFILSVYGNGNSLDEFFGMDNFNTLLFGSTGDHITSARTAKSVHNLFMTYLGNTFIVWVGNFIPQIALSLALAVWFTDAKLKIPGKGFFKIVMYMPNIITAASVAALFLKLFAESKNGAVNQFLLDMGWVDEPVKFVMGHTESRFMIMIIQAWMWFGNTMIMLMSGIMGLNPSLFEAANIDGASGGQVFRKITLPLLRPIMVYTLVTSMIGGLQMFDIPYMYHKGTAQNDWTKTVAVYIYQNFREFKGKNPNYGYAAAASVILFIITLILGSFTFIMNRDAEAAKHKKMRKMEKKALKLQKKAGGVNA